MPSMVVGCSCCRQWVELIAIYEQKVNMRLVSVIRPIKQLHHNETPVILRDQIQVLKFIGSPPPGPGELRASVLLVEERIREGAERGGCRAARGRRRGVRGVHEHAAHGVMDKSLSPTRPRRGGRRCRIV